MSSTKKNQLKWKRLALIPAVGFGLELLGRAFGLHAVPLYEPSPIFEYRLQPNQQCVVFGKELRINALGLRGELPSSEVESVVWYCGDSIINGGVHTHEDSLATAKWDAAMEQKLEHPVATVNVSQGSWGPENTLSFCREYSTKLGKPGLIVLALSSHDWDDRMAFCYAGDSRDMPSKARSAAGNLLHKLLGPLQHCQHPHSKQHVKKEMDGWLHFASELEAEMCVYLHPTQVEILSQSRSSQGQRLTAWCHERNVRLVDGMKFLNLEHFRDEIHLNEAGQAELAEIFVSHFAKDWLD